jgi:hypothetical protein
MAAHALIRSLASRQGTSWKARANRHERNALARLIESRLLHEHWTAVHAATPNLSPRAGSH